MKKQKDIKKLATFTAGMAAMAALVLMTDSVLAAGGQISCGQVGVRLFGQQTIAAGETYTAPNGQEVPSSMTYTDTTGGKTNYLSVRQISQLLDANIGWNADANSVDIAAPDTSGVKVVADAASELPVLDQPEYGRIAGVYEEVDPSTVDVLKDTTEVPAVYMKDTRIQYQYFGFPEFTAEPSGDQGQYLVYTVTNNGKTDQYTTVSHKVTIASGMRESFSNVVVKPGKTLVRVFRIVKDATPLQAALSFGIGGEISRDASTDVTVSLARYA